MDQPSPSETVRTLRWRGLSVFVAIGAGALAATWLRPELALPATLVVAALGLVWLGPVMGQLSAQAHRLEGLTRDVREGLQDMAGAVYASAEGIARFDGEDRIIWVNPACAKLLGFTPEELVGAKGVDRIHPDDLELARPAFEAMRVSGRGSAEVRALDRDGAEVFVRVELSRVSADADDAGYFVYFVDVSEAREIEAALARKGSELERLNAELEQFAYVAAHDLQEPSRKIVSFAALLEKDLPGELPEDVRRDLYFMTDAARRMQQLVRDLLHLSRAVRTAMNPETLQLDQCVDDALEALMVKVEETGAEIVREPLPEVEGDRTLITQLYQNLISNALKFCDSHRPEVHITVETSPVGSVLGVRDNGIGIDPEYRSQIFQPFKRLHGRSEFEGTGIGLAICQKAVERHGGRIWVESEPGKGSHFRFTLGPGSGGPA